MAATAPPSTSTSTTSSASPYPFASAPDIIRAHQKDAYFTGSLANTLTDIHRDLLGARSAHARAPELRTAAAVLYLALTTLPGNRTLGEEYCDLVQVDSSSSTSLLARAWEGGDSSSGSGRARNPGRLPAVGTRAAYILSSVLVPYFATRALPKLRSRIRALLTRRLTTLEQRQPNQTESAKSNKPKPSKPTVEARVLSYIAHHLLPALATSSPLHALTLTLFYFSGSYYELSKRLLSLRYVFTRTVPDTPDRAGYEVLGVLLVVQLGMQAYLHFKAALAEDRAALAAARGRASGAMTAAASTGHVDVSLDQSSYAANSALLFGSAPPLGSSKVDIPTTTNTPLPPAGGSRFDLGDTGGASGEKASGAGDAGGGRGENSSKRGPVMGYIRGAQQRKCTLCLDAMRDPAATQCGHVFCWECIGDWVREKPECPLCRREALAQHILPLRVA